MPKIDFEEILPYSAKDLFDLVMDAKNYPNIISVIKKVDTNALSATETEVDATIEIPVLGMPVHYKCVLEEVAPLQIKATATKSPFKKMEGGLTFTGLPDGQTKVHCKVDYNTGFNPIAIAAGIAMQTQIDAGRDFVKRYLDDHNILPKVTPGGGGTSKPPSPAP